MENLERNLVDIPRKSLMFKRILGKEFDQVNIQVDNFWDNYVINRKRKLYRVHSK